MGNNGRHDVLIDASNLNVGGGIQVASSFIDELSQLRLDPIMREKYPWLDSILVEASPAVCENLTKSYRANLSIQCVSRRPSDLKQWLPTRSRTAVLFKVFGPHYGLRRARRQIVGFADVTSVYPRPTRERRSPRERVRWWFRGVVSRRLMRSADRIVVETSAIRAQLCRRTPIPVSIVSIVPNAYNAVFNTVEPVDVFPLGLPEGTVAVACIARGYPHKNLDFLGKLGLRLHQLGTHVAFVVTLTPEEWAARTPTFRQFAHNIGPQPINRIPAVYSACRAAIFPSLLEAFSVTPVEAMKAGTPLFAADRDFVRSTCGDVPIYFDPIDAGKAAAIIHSALESEDALRAASTRGQTRVEVLPTARDRALNYLQIVDQERRKALC
jgi:glycosyltransferase involved in cell wall biosynthesis